jgi:hypothetical protein
MFCHYFGAEARLKKAVLTRTYQRLQHYCNKILPVTKEIVARTKGLLIAGPRKARFEQGVDGVSLLGSCHRNIQKLSLRR